jgi:TM2 domain-containing membrane protein YozV
MAKRIQRNPDGPYEPYAEGVATVSLVYAKSSLDQRELQMLESEVRSRGKSLTVAYLLWFFLGIFWVHRFYLKRGGGVFLMASLVSLVLCIFLIGFLLLMILSFIWLADAFRMSGFAQEYNGKLEAQIITEILAARAGGGGMPYGAGYAYQPAPHAPAYAPTAVAQPAYASSAPTYANQPTAVAQRAPNASGTGRLVVAEGGRSTAHNVAPGQSLTVGRGADADVRLSDPRSSRHHLTVALTPSGWLLRDLGSTNPSRVLESSGNARDLRGETTISGGQVLVGDALITFFPPSRG